MIHSQAHLVSSSPTNIHPCPGTTRAGHDHDSVVAGKSKMNGL